MKEIDESKQLSANVSVCMCTISQSTISYYSCRHFYGRQWCISSFTVLVKSVKTNSLLFRFLLISHMIGREETVCLNTSKKQTELWFRWKHVKRTFSRVLCWCIVTILNHCIWLIHYPNHIECCYLAKNNKHTFCIFYTYFSHYINCESH